MSLKEKLENSDKNLQKAIDTTQITGTPGNAGDNIYVPVSLRENITDVSRRATPLVDIFLPRALQGAGNAHSFNKRLSPDANVINPRNAVYADGGTPTEVDTEYATVNVPYVQVGYKGSVTDFAQAQGRAFIDLFQTEVEAKMALVKEALEWLLFWGSTSTTNTAGLTQFAGLDELITTNTVDAGGSRLEGTTGKAIIDEATEKIAQQGGFATHIITSIRTKQNLNNTYFNGSANGARIILNDGNDRTDLSMGEIVGRINTNAGQLQVVDDFFLNPGNTFTLPNGTSSTPSGATTSTAFILSERFLNFVSLSDLQMVPLARTADKMDFFVKIYTTLELTAEEYCAKITNINDTNP